MNQWIDRVESHPVFKELEGVEQCLESAKVFCQNDIALVDHWDRGQAVLGYIRNSLAQINPALLTIAQLNNISSPLSQAKGEISSFVSNKNSGHWDNAQRYFDDCLTHVAYLPHQSVADVESMREAASSYRISVSNLLEAIRQDGQGVSNLQADLQRKINDAASEISSQKQRLDNAIASFQQQFSDAQQTRQTEFSSAEQVRATAAANSEETRQSSFEQAEERRKAAELEASENASKTHADLISSLKSAASIVLVELERNKKHAQKLVGIISDTGMAHGFQKTANDEKTEATVWKRVAALSLIAWIMIAGVFFALTYDKDLTVAAVARQFLLSTPFVLLAGFAALQVSRHQKNERQLRQAEHEIASIDPFLATLSDEDRNSVKKEFASRYFGQRDIDHKQEPTEPKLLDIAGQLTKLVQELTKR